MNEKANPNAKPKIIPFSEWIESLELKKTEVSCEFCDGDGSHECAGCCGEGTIDCEKCLGSGLVGGCLWCDNEGGRYDEHPGIESTGWVVCEYCHGRPLEKCDCKNGETECENDGCFSGKIECDECGGAGIVTEYSPRNKDHLEQLNDLGMFLFWDHDDKCYYGYLENEYQWIRIDEDRLMAERGKLGDLK